MGAAVRRCPFQSIEYDDVVNGMLPGPAEPVPEGAFEELNEQGRVLCEELRIALGDGWRVAYATFPDGRHLQWETDGPVRPG